MKENKGKEEEHRFIYVQRPTRKKRRRGKQKGGNRFLAGMGLGVVQIDIGPSRPWRKISRAKVRDGARERERNQSIIVKGEKERERAEGKGGGKG